MASEKQGSNKVPDWAGSNKSTGVKLDSGPYIGLIKNNSDPARQGRLAVWLPDVGGDENDPTKWYVVRYASPFFGSTLGSDPNSAKRDSFNVAQQTYGFWAVPPDIGNLVLVSFVMGDSSRGYWFACIQNIQTQHMVPGMARPFGNVDIGIGSKINLDPTFGKGRITNESLLPTAELISVDAATDKSPEFYDLGKVVHTYQANIVIQQGLDKDPVRGTISSSSQRETPSYVVGLSSPGRAIPDTADFPNLDRILDQQLLKIGTVQQFPNRKGGHTFVMDDGDIYGQSRLTRLRSSGGHQILMHDTENVMYISNSLGTSWIELTPGGSINIYSGGSVNVHALEDLNFHADQNVNIHAGDTIKMYAEKSILMQTETNAITATKEYSLNSTKVGIKSGTSLLMQSTSGGWKTSADLILKGRKIYLNTSTPASPTTNEQFDFYHQANVEYDQSLNMWKTSSETFESISPFTPTHEPWTRQTGKLKKSSGKISPATAQTPGKK